MDHFEPPSTFGLKRSFVETALDHAWMLGVYRPDPGMEFHISDHRLAALIHMHMLDPDSLRIAVPQTP
jgi:hypothetical protein